MVVKNCEKNCPKKIFKILRLATLNIGTLTERTKELGITLKRQEIDIACIQETKWAVKHNGTEGTAIDKGYNIFNFGGDPCRNGVGIIVKRELLNNILTVNYISDRLISIDIKIEDVVLSIISCYAPQTGRTNDTKNQFWSSLDNLLQMIDSKHHVLIGGDLNGHVGLARDGYPQCHGGQGFGKRNDDGVRILNCAEAHKLIIANTFMKKNRNELITYTSGIISTQIDYWLLKKSDLKVLKDIKVLTSERLAPQHKILILNIRLEIGKRKKVNATEIERIKWWKLSENKEELSNAFNNIDININQNLQEFWNNISSQIKKMATEILGKTKVGKYLINKETWWWNNEVQQIVRNKKMAYKNWKQMQLDENYQVYKKVKLEAKKVVALAKHKQYEHLYRQLYTPFDKSKMHKIASSQSNNNSHIKSLKNKNGQILKDPQDISNRWHEYFSQYYKKNNLIYSKPNINIIFGPVPQITALEVEAAIQRVKDGKSTGIDDIPVEAWKIIGYRGINILVKLFNKIVEEGKAPRIWMKSILIPIWIGKGDIRECVNYNPIHLKCHTMKIFERVLENRIRDIVTVSPNQCKFFRNRGMIDAIYAARLLIEKHREKTEPLHMVLLELEKEFEKIPRELIWNALRYHGVPEAYIRWTQLLYDDVKGVIRSPFQVFPTFPIQIGINQGSVLSSLLSILCIDIITAEIQIHHPWTLFFGDNILLSSKSRQELESIIISFKLRLEENGISFNLNHVKYMECGKQTNNPICIDQQNLNKVTELNFLNSILRSDGEITSDVRSHINVGWTKWHQLIRIFTDKKIPMYIKIMVYKNVIRSSVLFGAECWPALVPHQNALDDMEMKMLKWILNKSEFKVYKKEDVLKITGVRSILDKISEMRLFWFGHVKRSDENTVINRVFHLKVEGKRPQGSPNKRLSDVVKYDMKKVNAEEEDAMDRNKWRRICQKPDPSPIPFKKKDNIF